jgi:hypothetical protein
MAKRTDPIRRSVLLIILVGILAAGGLTALDYSFDTGFFRKTSGTADPPVLSAPKDPK